MTGFSTIRQLFRGLIKDFRADRISNDVERLVMHSFFTRTDFRVQKYADEKPLALERAFVRSVAGVWSLPSQPPAASDGRLHLHYAEFGKDIWNQYLSDTFHLNLPRVAKDAFRSADGWSGKVSLTVQLVLFYIFLRPLYSRRFHRRKLLIVPDTYVCICNLLRYTERNRITEVFYTAPFEPDANVISFFLMRNGIRVNMLVSGTPLFRYLKEIYCDKLMVTNAYQQEEVKHFASGIQVGSVEICTPFTWKRFITIYEKLHPEPAPNTFAVYTAGVWKRREKGVYFDPEVEQAEQLIFRTLARYANEEDRNMKLKVYMHPVEKKDRRDYEKAIRIYSEGFEPGVISFAAPEEQSDHHFHEENVALLSVSNIVSERLFSGFKIILVLIKEQDFPLPDSPLRKAAAYNEEELFDKIKTFTAMPRKEYFSEVRLGKYCYEPIRKLIAQE